MYKNYLFLVVDDERLSRSYIRDLIEEFVPGASVMEARTAEAAKNILQEGVVDVLFLDVRMPGNDGFALLDMVEGKDFELVFITAHSHYAIQAIKRNAVDYILKPIKKTEFREMILRVLQRRDKTMEKRFGGLESKEAGNYLQQKLVINHQQGINFIKLQDIVYLKADNTYTTLCLTDGQKIITSKPINKFESSLSTPWFFRIHKSYIVNTAHFKEYISRNGNVALMDNGDKLLISRYRLSEFLEVIKSASGEINV